MGGRGSSCSGPTRFLEGQEYFEGWFRMSKLALPHELESKLLKGGYVGDYIGDNYRGY